MEESYEEDEKKKRKRKKKGRESRGEKGYQGQAKHRRWRESVLVMRIKHSEDVDLMTATFFIVCDVWKWNRRMRGRGKKKKKKKKKHALQFNSKFF
jgi:hypothetical protein